MRIHPNAKTTPKSRAVIVQRVEQEGWTVAETAAAFGVSRRTVWKWRRRWREEGWAGLEDRSARPHRMSRRTAAALEERLCRLRREERLSSPQIARRLGLARSTVGAVLRRHGLGRSWEKAGARPSTVRYERQRPGELLHLDIKPLGRIERVGHRIHGERSQRVRGAGWEYVHVAVDDASRVAYVEVRESLRTADACAFLERAVRWFGDHGVRVERVMTDNGSAYTSREFAELCRRLQVRHLRTRPYRPRTNGKAERFIQTLLREWAYARAYRHSRWRRRALASYLARYNGSRPHAGLGYKVPMARLSEALA